VEFSELYEAAPRVSDEDLVHGPGTMDGTVGQVPG
jgi:hypothetical protein